MEIAINECGGKKLCLRLPSGLVLNRITAAFLSGALKRKGTSVAGKHLYVMFRAIRRYKILHPEWKLIEIYESNGESVEITL